MSNAQKVDLVRRWDCLFMFFCFKFQGKDFVSRLIVFNFLCLRDELAAEAGQKKVVWAKLMREREKSDGQTGWRHTVHREGPRRRVAF